jgi:hypothetical protein
MTTNDLLRKIQAKQRVLIWSPGEWDDTDLTNDERDTLLRALSVLAAVEDMTRNWDSESALYGRSIEVIAAEILEAAKGKV